MICPRCHSDAGYVISRSPVEGEWEMYNCKVCGYSWRSTDVPQNRSPEDFPENFRWKADEIDKFAPFPPIAGKK